MDRSDSSVRSHSRGSEKSQRRPPTWDGSPPTDFAITTINVPDRLDIQEVRAREEEDNYRRRSWFSVDRYAITLWSRRLFTIAVVAGLGWLGYSAIAPLSDELSKDAIAARLSSSIGVPVKIADREFSVWPQPKMVLRGLDLDGRIKADEVTLQLSWNEVVRAAKAGRVAFGEAVVAPIRLNAQQSGDLIRLGPQLAGAAGPTVATVRFSMVEFPDFSLLPHRYQIVVRRGPAGSTSPVEITQIGGEGRMQLLATAQADDAIAFELEAERWLAPIGPAVVWSNIEAAGRALPNAVIVDSYTASSPFGVAQGALVAASDVAWSVAGTSRSVSVDLETLMQQLAGVRPDDVNAPKSPLLGTATLTLIGGGHGPSLADALFESRLSGPAAVRFATLNGINLGLAATQGGAAEIGGGITRFTDLSADIDLTSGGLVLRDIAGRAGAMATRGQVSVSPDLKLSGTVRVDLGAERVQAPTTLRVSGTAVAPRFGRP